MHDTVWVYEALNDYLQTMIQMSLHSKMTMSPDTDVLYLFAQVGCGSFQLVMLVFL